MDAAESATKSKSAEIAVLNPNLPRSFHELLARYAGVKLVHDREGESFDDVRVIVTTPMDQVTGDFLESLPSSVGLIATVGVGTDHIDLSAAADRGITVSNTPVVTEDTADLTFALILACCRRVTAGERALRAGNWAQAQIDLGLRVSGKSLGIIGLGEIGKAVAKRALGFGMAVKYWGPRRKPHLESELGVTWAGTLEVLLAESDIISLHCSLTPETHHLIDAARIAQIKPGAILVNAGRGQLVDETALVSALENGSLAAAALDVFEAEPNVPPALLQLDNVVLTPHIGSATAECRRDMAIRLCMNIDKFLTNGDVPDRVA